VERDHSLNKGMLEKLEKEHVHSYMCKRVKSLDATDPTLDEPTLPFDYALQLRI